MATILSMENKMATTAKNYLLQWATNYRQKYDVQYPINWQGETMIVRKLMSKMSHREMVKLFDFAFTDHPACSYIRTQGHRLYHMQREYASLLVAMKSPGSYIPDDELVPDLPFWEDERVAWVWTLILRSDLEGLKEQVRSNAVWDLLLAKILRQDGFIPEQVQWLYDMWKANETIERKAIKHD